MGSFYDSHKPRATITMWKARIPLQLARSGTSSPIDISIHTSVGRVRLPMTDHHRGMFSPLCLQERYNFTAKSCPCLDGREQLVASALEILAGKTGEVCERWRSLELKLGPCEFRIDPFQEDDQGILPRGLTYPTPALKILKMSNVTVCDPKPGSSHYMLPFTPIVEEMGLFCCFLPGQLSTPIVRNVKITTGSGKRYITSPKPIFLDGSNLIEELQINIRASWVHLPQALSRLKSLTIDGASLPQGLRTCRMSRLEYLSFDVGHLGTAQKLLLECPNFPFAQIRRLDFKLCDRFHWEYTLEELQASILEILRAAASSLTSLHSLEVIHGIVLKWIWEYRRSSNQGSTFGQDVGLYFRNKVVLSTGNSTRELTGNEGCADLERIAQGWGITSPDSSWDVLVSELDRASHDMSSW